MIYYVLDNIQFTKNLKGIHPLYKWIPYIWITENLNKGFAV